MTNKRRVRGCYRKKNPFQRTRRVSASKRWGKIVITRKDTPQIEKRGNELD